MIEFSEERLTESTISPVLPLGSDLPLTGGRDSMGNIDNRHPGRLGRSRFSIQDRGILDKREIFVVVHHDIFLPIVCGLISHLEWVSERQGRSLDFYLYDCSDREEVKVLARAVRSATRQLGIEGSVLSESS
jgi:hypothetical protein